jgi:hypothetical protein
VAGDSGGYLTRLGQRVSVSEPLLNVVKPGRANGDWLYRALAKMAGDRSSPCLVGMR